MKEKDPHELRVHFGRDEGIDRGRITLTSPDVLNAMNAQLRIELEKARDDLNEAEAVKVVILRGRGVHSAPAPM